MQTSSKRSRSVVIGIACAFLAWSTALALAGCAGTGPQGAVDGSGGAVIEETPAGVAPETGDGDVETQVDAKADEGVDDGAEATGAKGAADGDVAGADGAEAAPTPTTGGIAYPGGDTTGTLPAAFDWTLTDQYGVRHSLSDYRGKVVFLNFWTTWCPYCVQEMPDIQALYEDYGLNEGDVVVLGVGNPVTDDHPNNSDVTQGEIVSYLAELGVTYPMLMDTTSEVFSGYRVYYLPTTYMIDPYGNVFGSVSGALDRQTMDEMVEQTLAGKLEG